MKIVRSILLLGACGLFAASCSSDSDPNLPGTGAVDPNFEIVPSSGLGRLSASNRAAVDPSETTNLAVSVFRVDQTAADTYPEAFTAVSAPKAATLAGDTREASADATINFTAKEFFLSDGLKTKVLAVYPAVTADEWTAEDNELAYAIDGKTDIMATSWGEGYKDLSQNPVVAVQPDDMVFDHLLTQIRVKVYAEDDDSRDYWGDIESVSVTGRATTATLSLPDTDGQDAVAFTPGSETSGSFAMITAADATATLEATAIPTVKDDAELLGHALFAPVTTNAKLPLTIVTKVGDVEISTDIEVAAQQYAAGTAYTITLKLTTTDIVPEGVTISAWEELEVDEIEI